ncbi:MAG: ATPase domain-containing protein [Candidatus Thermoplasmatota archaeon]
MFEIETSNAKKGCAERVKTGIFGLDEKISGGLPQGSIVLVTGTPGSGKSLLAMQYLVNGAVQYNEKGLYISSEQPKQEIADQAGQFGWDLMRLEQEGKIKIVAVNSQEFFEISKMNELKQLILTGGYKRLVIDSTTSIALATMNPSNLVDSFRSGLHPESITEIYKATLISLIDTIKQTGITALLIAQKVEGRPGDTIDMTSEFRADGLWVLDARMLGQNENRTLQIKKMRKTKITIRPFPIEFTDKGVSLI